MPADVDEPVAGDGAAARRAGLHRLVAAADGGERHHREHRVEQPRRLRLGGLRRVWAVIQTTRASSSGGQIHPSVSSVWGARA